MEKLLRGNGFLVPTIIGFTEVCTPSVITTQTGGVKSG